MSLIYRTQTLTEFWANSGSAVDIQITVDEAHISGGGIVRVPEGNFNFGSKTQTNVFGLKTGVIVPGGVDLIGMGEEDTVIIENIEGEGGVMITLDGESGLPIEAAGFTLEGTVTSEAEMVANGTAQKGIQILRTKDFNVHHVKFRDWASAAIHTVKHDLAHIHQGVIHHCNIDNPYKDILWDTGIPSEWAYGILVNGVGSQWQPIEDLLGKYGDNVVYIEDCVFSRCRYPVASNTSGYYVSRHNTLNVCPNYGTFGKAALDVHEGATGYAGGRGLEAYANTIVGTGAGQQAFKMRGGSGVIYNNMVSDLHTSLWLLKAEWANFNERNSVTDLYYYNNTLSNVSQDVSDAGGYTEGTHYFLYERPGYIPFEYPHPFATTEVLPPQISTPYSEELQEGTYNITVPQQVEVVGEIWNFKQWEDGSTDPIRTINLQSDTTISATYEESVTAGLLQVRAYTDETEINIPVEVIEVGIKVTPFNVSLEFGTYTIVAPSSTIVGDEIHTFSSWEDGSTNPERTLDFTSDLTVEARYIPPTPIPPEEPTKGFLEIHGFYGETEIEAKGRVLEGNIKFTTPVRIELEAGTYTITCRYRARLKRWTVKVVAGQTVRVDFQFRLPTGLSKTLPRVTQIYGFPVLSRLEDKKQEWRR